MNNEWKELKIDNLPSDINNDEYDFQYWDDADDEWMKCSGNTFKQCMIDFCRDLKCRYRKRL